MGELLGFNRIRYTDGRTDINSGKLFATEPLRFTPDPNGVSVVHFCQPNSSATWCGMENGPKPEDVDDDVPVTCKECKRRVRAVFRWWFPRKAFPSWLEASNV